MVGDVMKYETLKFELAGAVATITLHRPDVANAFNQQLADELLDAAEQCSNNSKIRSVILTGEGQMFCAGGDVGFFADAGDAMDTHLQALTASLHAAIQRFQRMNAPLIIAVNGVAAGAGMSFVLTGDIVYAAESAKFTMAYTKIGLSPDCSGTFFLPRLVGLMKAKQLMLRNPLLTAAEAQELGIVTEVVEPEQLLPRAEEIATLIAENAPLSVEGTKAQIQEWRLTKIDEAWRLGNWVGKVIHASEDSTEGPKAFAEKREPTWQGR